MRRAAACCGCSCVISFLLLFGAAALPWPQIGGRRLPGDPVAADHLGRQFDVRHRRRLGALDLELADVDQQLKVGGYAVHRPRDGTDIARLFEAFASAEALKAWWWPNGLHADRIDYDFREGGRYFINMKGQVQGKDVSGGMTGQFEEIVENERIVLTDNGPREAFLNGYCRR